MKFIILALGVIRSALRMSLIRFKFGLEKSRYEEFCDAQAYDHYGIAHGPLRRLQVRVTGFLTGITCREIPAWYIAESNFNKKSILRTLD